ncbi:hypothetical protein [Cellvibrio sp.]|uniref:hypothetical protein n=1 Tax=Cellvibrio sp. TaxID=1965322 RepID=UPI00396476B9
MKLVCWMACKAQLWQQLSKCSENAGTGIPDTRTASGAASQLNDDAADRQRKRKWRGGSHGYANHLIWWGMLFEYMLSDEHLPDSVKALLSYLHTPF